MKKTLVLAMLLAQASFGFAEDNIHFAPFHATAGYGLDGSGDLSGDGAVKILLNNSDGEEYVGIQFEMNVPAGMPVTFDIDECTRIKPKKLGKNHHVHTISDAKPSSYPGYEKYIVTITDQTDNCAFLGESGDDVMVMYYGVPTTFSDGVYPIYMTGVQLIYKSASYKALSDITSYMVVGNPTNQTLVAKGDVPSFVNTVLADETAISKVDFSAVTSVNGTFTYVDGREVVAPTTDVTANVAYKRSVPAGKYASVCLPFNANLSCYTYSETSGDYAIFSPAASLSAGTPAIVNGNIDVTAEGVTLGNATKQTKSNGYYLKDGFFCKVNGTATIPALRGWWNLDTPSSNLRLMLDGNLTDINLLDVDAAEGNAYDLQGRRSASAKNGVYVVNGKKQLVK